MCDGGHTCVMEDISTILLTVISMCRGQIMWWVWSGIHAAIGHIGVVWGPGLCYSHTAC